MARKRAPSRKPTPPRSETPAGTLRVLGGVLRGRPIQYLGESRTRPMKQRVREAAFNLIGPRVRGAHVVDLFAGTGALAWEALSRGACSATLLERHFPTARLIRKNAAAFGLAERIELIPGDTFVWAKRLGSAPEASPTELPWLVFCSPPYDLYVTQREPMMQLIARIIDVAPAGSLLVVEADERFDVTDLPTQYTWDVRRYPPAVLAIGEIPVPSEPPRI